MSRWHEHPRTPVGPPPEPPLRAVAVVLPMADAYVYLDDVTPLGHVGRTDANGYVEFVVTPLPISYLHIEADGFEPYQVNGLKMFEGNFQIRVGVPADPNRPQDMLLPALTPIRRVRSLAQLAKIRGAMWTQYLNLPLGPRPGQDNNICAMDFYEFYGADDRKRMIDKTLEDGHTHAVTGPFYDANGYHGLYPTSTDLSEARWNHYLDAMQEWADAGITPVHFQKPDNWPLEMLRDKMEHLYATDRAKALLPILVPAGWEPALYEWSSRTWRTYFDWAASVNPDALILAHTTGDVDAMKGTDAWYNDEPETNDKAWQYQASSLHGWLIQLLGYVNYRGRDVTDDQLRTWERNLREYFEDLDRRFRHGYAGWPTGSKFGANIPMKLYCAEVASYKFFWDGNVPESLVKRFGDIAMAAGADGYLDNGSTR